MLHVIDVDSCDSSSDQSRSSANPSLSDEVQLVCVATKIGGASCKSGSKEPTGNRSVGCDSVPRAHGAQRI